MKWSLRCLVANLLHTTLRLRTCLVRCITMTQEWGIGWCQRSITTPRHSSSILSFQCPRLLIISSSRVLQMYGQIRPWGSSAFISPFPLYLGRQADFALIAGQIGTRTYQLCPQVEGGARLEGYSYTRNSLIVNDLPYHLCI